MELDLSNETFCGDLSDDSSCESSDSDNELSDFDNSLLENADEVLKVISPQKVPTIFKETVSKRIKKPKTEPKQRKALTKGEMRQIMDNIKEQRDEIVKVSITYTENEQFWSAHPHYLTCIKEICAGNLLNDLGCCVFEDYIDIFESCNKGSTKYDDFQLKWFQNASRYLSKCENQNENMMKTIGAILALHEIENKDHFLSCLVSSIHQSIFSNCYKFTIDLKTDLQKQVNRNTMSRYQISEKQSDVEHKLYNVHGWVLKEALAYCSKKKGCTLTADEKKIWKSVCDNIVSDDKSVLPNELKHLDRGGLTFPKPQMLPFMQECDLSCKALLTQASVKSQGDAIGEHIKSELKLNEELFLRFRQCVLEQPSDMTNVLLMKKMYDFWMEKFANVKIKDSLLIGSDKLELTGKAKITTQTLNLRDELKTDYVRKSKSKK